MKNGKTYNKRTAFSLLLIGPPKSGKTSLAMSFPRPYILDADRNLAGVLRRFEPPVFFYDTPQEEFPNAKDEFKLWKHCVKCLEEACTSEDVETIFIDGLSNLATWLQASILHDAVASGKHKLSVAGENVMEQAYWGPFRNKMAQLMMVLKASGKILVVSCHEDTLTNETGAVIG